MELLTNSKNLVERNLVVETKVMRGNLPLGPLCPPQILHDLAAAGETGD
jgi:hypothetical protein